jgi:hypothetical protein
VRAVCVQAASALPPQRTIGQLEGGEESVP